MQTQTTPQHPKPNKQKRLTYVSNKNLPLEYLKSKEMVKSYRLVELKSDENPDKLLKPKYISNLLSA